MKMIRLSVPFAFFMLVGNVAFSAGLSSEALQAMNNLVHSTKQSNTQNNQENNNYPNQGYQPIYNSTISQTQYVQAAPQDQSQQNRPNPNTLRVAGKCPEHYPLGAPLVVMPDRDKIERRSFYLCRIGYAVQFDPATKTPLWSAEKLDAGLLVGAKEPRSNDFRPDPEVPAAAQATLNDYKGSHFDRGHNTPAADQTGRGDGAMSQSFYLTNMFPQVGENQNRGIWADLEAQVRQWAQQRGEVLVVTGPIFDQGTVAVGRSKVWVPTRLYKVVIDPKTLESIAFIMPNRQIVTRKTRKLDEGGEYPQTQAAQAINCGGNPCSAENFVVSVAAVEQATGLRFFSALPDNVHQKVVQSIGRNWSFR